MASFLATFAWTGPVSPLLARAAHPRPSPATVTAHPSGGSTQSGPRRPAGI